MSGTSILLLIIGIFVLLSGLYMLISRKKIAPNMSATQGWGQVSPRVVALMGVAQMAVGSSMIAVVTVLAIVR